MGMLDGKPFIPKTGAPVLLRHRRYVLRWHPEWGRTLFCWPLNSAIVKAEPSYFLLPRELCETCAHKNCKFHFDVISVRTGKKYDELKCYMVQVKQGDPTVKRPWWHDGRTSFQRNARWFL